MIGDILFRKISTKRLARRVIFVLVLASSVVTLMITALQLYRGYQHEISILEQRFQQLESVNIPSIAHSLWKTDKQELMLQLEGILRLPDVEYLVVRENGDVVIEVGAVTSQNVMSRKYPLRFEHRGEMRLIGSLEMVVTLDNIYQQLMDEVWQILISNAIKTFIVAGLMLFIFQYMVTRHLFHLASQVGTMDVTALDKPVRLHRKSRYAGEEDELDILVSAFDKMRQNIRESFDKITRREEYLRRYESILSTTKDMVSYVDRSYTYRAVNKAYLDMYGKQEHEIVGHTVEELLGPTLFHDVVKPRLDRVFAGEHLRFNMKTQDKTARLFDVEVNYSPYYSENGEALGAVVNVRDISERLAAETERERNAQVYAALAQQGAINFNTFVNSCLNLLQHVFDAKFIMVGQLSPHAMKVQTLTVLIDGKHVENFTYELTGTPCEKVFNREMEFVYEKVAERYPKDIFLVDLKAECFFGLPLIDTRGFTVGLLVIIDDKPGQPQSWHAEILSAFAARISLEMERANVLAKLENYNAELEYRVKLRTNELENSIKDLETFSYSVSHDLRTPLRAINGYSRLLLEDFEESIDERAQAYLNNIIKASERMGLLIDSLLKLSRIGRQALELQHINLTELAANILNDYKDSANKEINIVVQDNLYCTGDKNLIQIAIDNLVSNAFKYSAKCTHPQIEFGADSSGAELVYFIRDNGVGFDERYSDKLFEPFQRLHDENEYQGLGIGLATVRRIFHRHGGRIWAESKQNCGATFYFTLGEAKKYAAA